MFESDTELISKPLLLDEVDWEEAPMGGGDVEGEEAWQEERGWVPGDLDSWEPGPVLAALLSSIDPRTLSGEDRVRLLRAAQRQASWAQGVLYRAMASIPDACREELEAEGDEELVWEAAEAEVGVALRLTRRAASWELSVAEDLSHRLPEVGLALEEGRIDRPRALVLLRETAHLPQEAAREAVGRIIERAGGLTTGQLGARLRRLVMELRPEEAQDRFREALEERRVVVEATTEGTAHLLLLDLSPEQARAAASRIDRLARHLKTREETRTMDQLRADVACDLLVGKITGKGAGAKVEIRVDLETLAGLAEHPGDLQGYGPVVADVARQVAEEAQSATFSVTDSRTGEVLHTGVTRRRPTAAVARSVRARQPTCIFPGCRMPAVDCDFDHRRPHCEGGLPDEDNLGPLCRWHHRLRHQAGWTYVPTADGDYVWRSLLGYVYTTSGRSP